MPITLDAPVADDLYRLRDELIVETANTATLAFDARRLGTVDIVRGRGSVRWHIGELAVTPTAGYNDISTKERGFTIPFDYETDFGLRAEWPSDWGTFEGVVGANLRDDDDDVVRGQLNWNRWIGQKVRTDVSVWLNEVVDDTPIVRVIGTKYKFAVTVFGQITRFDSLRLTADGHRYQTRDGERIADGYRLDATLEHYILRKAPEWSVRLQGSWEGNSVAARLPAGTESVYFTETPTMSSIVSPEFGTFGGGTTVRVGSPEGVIRRPFLVADSWIGILSPSNTFAYSTSIGTGMSFSGRDKLSVNAFHSNTQGGQAEEPYEGVGITYSYLF